MFLYLVGVFPSREGLGVGAASFEVVFVSGVTEFQGLQSSRGHTAY